MVKCPKCGNCMLHVNSVSGCRSTTIRHVNIKLAEFYNCPICNSEVTLRYEKDVDMH